MAQIEKAQAHAKVLQWSYVLDWQVDRLRAARDAWVATHHATDWSGRTYTAEDSKPAHRVEAERYFTLVAARRLMRALDAFGGGLRLPSSLDQQEMIALRDSVEHFDRLTGKAQRKMAALGADPDAHQWKSGGPGVLGGLVSDQALKDWASAVYSELVDWDEWRST